jgi:beta-lactamase class A
MFVGEIYDNRNMLTTNALGRLFHSIIGGVAVSSSASQKMMDLLKRDVSKKNLDDHQEENQINGFLGQSLPNNANLWSKAGWTSKVRHDSAYIEIPDHKPYLLIVFTEGQENSKNRHIIPFISEQFMNL